MNFNELCADFSRRKPTVEVGEVAFITIEWKGKYVSSNDLLRTYLNSNKIPYLNDFNGTVWFLYDGEWTRTKVHYDRESNMAHYRRCVFEYDRGEAAKIGMENYMEKKSDRILKLKYIGDDFWSRPVYKDQFGKLWKDLNCGDSETPDLYWSVNNEFDEEPYLPIGCEFIIVKPKEKSGKEFQYMMLDRLRTDCDYYLGYGNRYAGVLAKGDEKEQIEAMKKLWLEFDEDKKPKWLTWAQILEYENQMCG